jgi:excisionase family DNA binding protein
MDTLKKYFNLTEAANYLGISKSSLYKKTASHLIPFIKPGKKILFNREVIDQWLEQFTQPTIQELQSNSARILKNHR